MVYQTFTLIPLTKVAACYRYLNVSWIFCIIFLAVLSLDDIPALMQAVLRRNVGLAIMASLLCILGAAAIRWPLISELWRSTSINRMYITGSLSSVVILSCFVLAGSRHAQSGRTAAVLSGVLVIEAVTWFLVPYLSFPRSGAIDNDVIAFLRANIGYQRAIGTWEASIAPNYGSYFGISVLNYDDVPVPKVSAEYIKNNLDPYAWSLIFIPSFPNLSPAKQDDRTTLFRENLPRYGRAGVKYVLSRNYPFEHPAFNISRSSYYAYALATGQRVDISARGDAAIHSDAITTVSLLVGTYNNRSSGHLKMTLCVPTKCAEGLADLALAEDNQQLQVALDRPISIEVGGEFTIRIEKTDGEQDVAIWMFPLDAVDMKKSIFGSATVIKDQYFPSLQFGADANLKLVHRSRGMGVYELPGSRDYFSANSCMVAPLSYDRVATSCSGPSRLIRLEANMRGWSATVNRLTAPIEPFEGAFQMVDLPPGNARVVFTFEPPGFRLALVCAGLALLLILAVFGRSAALARSSRTWNAH